MVFLKSNRTGGFLSQGERLALCRNSSWLEPRYCGTTAPAPSAAAAPSPHRWLARSVSASLISCAHTALRCTRPRGLMLVSRWCWEMRANLTWVTRLSKCRVLCSLSTSIQRRMQSKMDSSDLTMMSSMAR